MSGITFSFPVFPLLLAGLDTIFGRQFWPWRVVAGMLFALGASLVYFLGCRLGGPLVGALAGVFYLCDRQLREFFPMYMSEGLAVVFILVLTLGLLQLIGRPTRGWNATVGIDLALVILTRSIFVFLAPVVIVTACLTCWRTGRSQRWFRDNVTLRIVLPETGAAGIQQGSEVYFLGTLVGTVSDVVVDAAGRMEASGSV